MILLALAAQAAAPAAAPPLPPEIAAMAGQWKVDLRPKFSDPPYSQPMILTIAPDRSVTGAFYNSDILAGKAGRGQDRACVAFRTTDGKGLYHTSACLVAGKMVGMTWAEGRAFVLPWTAER